MRRFAALFLCGLLLTACRPAALSQGPAVATRTRAEPSAQPTVAGATLFFEHLDMMDAQSGWAWRGISQLYRTDDGGVTWHEIHLQGRMQVTGASFLNGQEAWLPGVPDAEVRQYVYHTINGGMSWTQLGAIPGPNLDLLFHDAHRGWALNGTGAAGNIYYQAYQTTDGGATWIHLEAASGGGSEPGPMAGSIHTMTGDSLSFMLPNTIWIASGYGLVTPYAGLAVSRDGGKTWQDVNPPLPADMLKGQPAVVVSAPQFVSEQAAFLPVRVGDRLVFFASHDAGNRWSLLPPILPAGQMIQRAQFVNLTDGFVACGAELCVTQDGGETWQQVATPFPMGPRVAGAFVSQFDFVDRLTGWAILMDQQGSAAMLKTTDGGRTWLRMQPGLGF